MEFFLRDAAGFLWHFLSVAGRKGMRAADAGMMALLLIFCHVPAQGAAVGCQTSFPSITTLEVGTNPVSLLVQDFNRDATPDVAVVNQGNGSVSVILAKGHRTFEPAINYSLSFTPGAITSADLDGDGNVDLAVVGNGPAGGLGILRGRTNGTFLDPVDQGNQPYCRCVKAGDLNGDSRIDLITAHDTGLLSVRLNSGSGTFPTTKEYSVGSRLFWLEVADFNGDQKLDVVAADFQGHSLLLLLGNGDGTFEAQSQIANGMDPVFLCSGDLNGDHKMDLVVGGLDIGEIRVFLGNGDGSFQKGVLHRVGSYPVAIALADFDGNQKMDLATINNFDGTCSIAHGNGDGAFKAAANYITGGKPTALAIADFDGDGNQDVAVANDLTSYSDGTVSILWGNRTGTLDAPMSSDDAGFASFLLSCDANKDGRPDLIGVESAGHVQVRLGVENGGFTSPVYYSLGFLVSAPGALGDFDGDGNWDLAFPTWSLPQPPFFPSQYAVMLLFGAGDGTFERRGAGVTCPSYITWIETGDFNQDGKSDLALIQQGQDRIFLYLGKGDGSFLTGENYSAGPGLNSPVLGDFNGDGRLDIAVSYNPGIALFLGNGNGTFEAGVPLTGGFSGALAASDLNGDGKADLVAVGRDDRNIDIWLSGEGGLQSPVEFPSGASPFYPSIADLNGDDWRDIVTLGRNSVAVLMNNGRGDFEPYVAYGVNENPSSLLIADFSHDGLPDIGLLSGGLTRRWSLLLNHCKGSAPFLAFQTNGKGGVFSWPLNLRDYTLEFTTNLFRPEWQTVAEKPVTNGERFEIELPFDRAASYFRLSHAEP